VLVVSHDRYFLDRTVEKILALEGEGKIREYPGNYSVYLDYQKQVETSAKVVKTAPPPRMSTMPDKKKSLSAWEKRDLESLEAKIAELESIKAGLEQQLAVAGYTELQPLALQLQDLEVAIDDTTSKWLALAERDS
jgi:ATP-binding cassette subfamily F protein uup